MKIIFTSTIISGQTLIAEQGFEGLGSDTWNYIPPTQNANAPQVLVGAANYGVGYAKVGNNSMRLGGGSTTCSTAASPNCVNGQSTGGNCNDNQNGRILQFQPVEISCYNNVRVSVAYRTHVVCSGGPGLDSGDQIFFEVSENGGPFSTAATINVKDAPLTTTGTMGTTTVGAASVFNDATSTTGTLTINTSASNFTTGTLTTKAAKIIKQKFMMGFVFKSLLILFQIQT
jgi:hypothetical protein